MSSLILPPYLLFFTRHFSEPSAGPWKGTGAFPDTFGMVLFLSLSAVFNAPADVSADFDCC